MKMKHFNGKLIILLLVSVIATGFSCRAPKEKPRLTKEQKLRQDYDKSQQEKVLEKETGKKKK
jgi:hypothetical protein